MNTFNLQHVDADGASTYAAPHELHNEVRITFPPGYFGNAVGYAPQEVDVTLSAIVPDVWTWGDDTAPSMAEMCTTIRNSIENDLTAHDTAHVTAPDGVTYEIEVLVSLIPTIRQREPGAEG